MNTTITENGNQLIITIDGRLDTTNVAEFEKQLQDVFQLTEPDVILNCEKLNYISSSGLRIFLTLQKSVVKNNGKLVIEHMQPAIREIFNMVGFTNIFTVR